MFKNLFCYLAVLLILGSCDQDGTVSNKSDNLPESNGGILDVIVVARESLWQSEAGDAFRRYFTKAQVGLPQPEAIFTVRQVQKEELNTLLKRSRNIVILEKGDKKVQIQQDIWAKQQLVITVSAKNEEALSRLIHKQQEKIRRQIKAHDIKHVQKKLSPTFRSNHPVLKKHHISMKIPKSFDLEQEKENLLVYWNRTLKTDQGIIIYFKPLKDELTTLGSEIIPLRDSLTELYILGEKEGSYMKTETMVAPHIIPAELDGVFAMETRGLWRVENDFMGGPFINFTIYDEKHKQLIFLDAFIFSPETSKRNFLLELEAILRTIEIGD